MRYHYQKPDIYRSMYGETYICNHPVYNKCTLFRIGDNGLAVIQQRFNADTRCGTCMDGLYPTVTIRQIMWALKMKPIQRQRWETCFDRREI